ncbi:DUF6292 family protein [Micromonospora sp. NBC_01813]|uniref:DUF6292 family protein n=1 Tax=Micromonospora sp. NBC_01813 TaxID=2975988 RepID=UPI002DD9D682|nr:DUF6292 family protein [Micromonospora sp. NBC_01813]WSA07034.1 DUF6292 family protein [Micromonospora sp. NBC_01813]
MTIDPGDDELSRLKERADHYVLAVAAALMRDGFPVTTGGTYTYPDPGEPEEAEFTLRLPDEYAVRGLGERGESLALDWAATSGWSLYVSIRSDDGQLADTEHWLGAGLVPPPQQVANFVAAAMVDWKSTGSPERPYYRAKGQDLGRLLLQLKSYEPSENPSSWGSIAYQFTLLRRTTAYQLAAVDTVSDDTIRAVPMRAGEVRALRRLLEFADNDGQARTLALNLVNDIQARFSSNTVDSPDVLNLLVRQYQSAWTRASEGR